MFFSPETEFSVSLSKQHLKREFSLQCLNLFSVTPYEIVIPFLLLRNLNLTTCSKYHLQYSDEQEEGVGSFAKLQIQIMRRNDHMLYLAVLVER